MKIEDFQPAKKAISLLDEFKNFAFKGNVIDLAVGVIIGGAFAKIVDSLVKNLLMPLVGLLLPGEKGYEAWAITIRGQSIPYGKFLAEVVNFLIVAVAIYLFIVKFLNWVLRFKAQQKLEPAMTKDQELLTEIRDLLRVRDGGTSMGLPSRGEAGGFGATNGGRQKREC